MNHENWQFSFVREIGLNTIWVPSLGWAYPLNVQFSNLTDGTKPYEELPNVTVSDDHIRVFYALPSDVIDAELDGGASDFTLTGKVRILKRTKGFPRGAFDALATLVLEEDYTGSISNLTRNEPYLFLDNKGSQSNNPIWYYTVFYEGVTDLGDTLWAFSPIYGHGRAFFLDSGESINGRAAYEYMPKAFRVLDTRKHSQQLFRFLQVLGKPLDEIAERLQKFLETKYDPSRVDAAFLPYIDQLLGWATNFELSEHRRRVETANAIYVWKTKGANDALEATIQNITGWDTELEEGYKYVLTTALPGEDSLDPNSPPLGWNATTDGDWATIVGGSAFNGTVDLSNPSNVLLTGDSTQNIRVLSDFSEDGWIEPRGVIVDLSTNTIGVLPSNVAEDKVSRLLFLLGIYYAKFKINMRPTLVQDSYSETLTLTLTDNYTDV